MSHINFKLLLVAAVCVCMAACSEKPPDAAALLNRYAAALAAEDIEALRGVVMVPPEGIEGTFWKGYEERFARIDGFGMKISNLTTRLDEDGSATATFDMEASWSQTVEQQGLVAAVARRDDKWRLRFEEVTGIRPHIAVPIASERVAPDGDRRCAAISGLLASYGKALEGADVDALLLSVDSGGRSQAQMRDYYEQYFDAVRELSWNPTGLACVIDGDNAEAHFDLSVEWRRTHTSEAVLVRLVRSDGNWMILTPPEG